MQFYDRVLNRYSKTTPVQKSYLSIGLTLGLLIILVVMIFPAVNHILKLNKEISDGKVVEQKLKDKIVALEEAESNYNNIKDRLSIVDQALPTGSAIEDYIKQIENAANANQLNMAGIQFSAVPLSLPENKQNLTIKQIDYSATFEGKFANIQKFLTQLETLIRTTEVSTAVLGGDQSQVSVGIQASAYYLGGQTAPQAQTAPANNSGTSNQTSQEAEGAQ
ncbi:MAG: type 4a pilus biogenesis protein PilO [Candidatus Woykebacteria bacterium]